MSFDRKWWMNCKNSTIDCISTTPARWNTKRLFTQAVVFLAEVELKKINSCFIGWINLFVSRKQTKSNYSLIITMTFSNFSPNSSAFWKCYEQVSKEVHSFGRNLNYRIVPEMFSLLYLAALLFYHCSRIKSPAGHYLNNAMVCQRVSRL